MTNSRATSLHTMELLKSHVATGDAASLEFAFSPALTLANYSAIIMYASLSVDAQTKFYITVNQDATANYTGNAIHSDASTISAVDFTAAAQWEIQNTLAAADNQVIAIKLTLQLMPESQFLSCHSEAYGLTSNVREDTWFTKGETVATLTHLKITSENANWEIGSQFKVYGIKA